MRRVLALGTIALAVLLLASPAIYAGGAKSGGTIVAVDEETDVYTIKGDDGKTYEVTDVSVVAEDLKTGDMVEYDLIEAKPVNVKKKSK